jgi:hypothetical protein
MSFRSIGKSAMHLGMYWRPVTNSGRVVDRFSRDRNLNTEGRLDPEVI